jgi:hypothetical protein
VHEGDIDFGMTINGQFNNFVGSTIKQQQIGWWSGFEELAEFAVWYRSYVPKEHRVLLWSKNFYNYVVSRDITEREIVTGLSGNRYSCKLSSVTPLANIPPTFIKELRLKWPDSIICGESWWHIKTLKGLIDSDETSINFDDNDLAFAAKFAVWCRTILGFDQRLTVLRSSSYPEPPEEFEIELTSNLAEQQLLELLNHTFTEAQ